MATKPKTTSFEDFIFAELLNEKDFEDISALDRAVTSAASEDPFMVSEADNGALIVEGRHITLVLTTPAAREGFLEFLGGKFALGFPSVEAWAGYSRAMAKDSS